MKVLLTHIKDFLTLFVFEMLQWTSFSIFWLHTISLTTQGWQKNPQELFKSSAKTLFFPAFRLFRLRVSCGTQCRASHCNHSEENENYSFLPSGNRTHKQSCTCMECLGAATVLKVSLNCSFSVFYTINKT